MRAARETGSTSCSASSAPRSSGDRRREARGDARLDAADDARAAAVGDDRRAGVGRPAQEPPRPPPRRAGGRRRRARGRSGRAARAPCRCTTCRRRGPHGRRVSVVHQARSPAGTSTRGAGRLTSSSGTGSSTSPGSSNPSAAATPGAAARASSAEIVASSKPQPQRLRVRAMRARERTLTAQHVPLAGPPRPWPLGRRRGARALARGALRAAAGAHGRGRRRDRGAAGARLAEPRRPGRPAGRPPRRRRRLAWSSSCSPRAGRCAWSRATPRARSPRCASSATPTGRWLAGRRAPLAVVLARALGAGGRRRGRPRREPRAHAGARAGRGVVGRSPSACASRRSCASPTSSSCSSARRGCRPAPRSGPTTSTTRYAWWPADVGDWPAEADEPLRRMATLAGPRMTPVVRRCSSGLSFTHSAVYAVLLVVWLVPGLHAAEFVFGLDARAAAGSPCACSAWRPLRARVDLRCAWPSRSPSSARSGRSSAATSSSARTADGRVQTERRRHSGALESVQLYGGRHDSAGHPARDGRVGDRGHRPRVAQAGGRPRRGRRDARRDLDRQGRRRGPRARPPAPSSKIHAAEGDTVTVGAVLAEIATGNGAAPAAAANGSGNGSPPAARRRPPSPRRRPARASSSTS